ncbi:unnamed protein product [Mesocestoides corti]|uniref:Galactosylgalactosylxylosylprotein 3-beta-glucuronosyltransferase n=1 Tax=Mesocestoides corti TaxID=53468 RepID=A0A0R3U9Z5_MESCO|nr:unnamed protein product [Mesocestoides corti]
MRRSIILPTIATVLLVFVLKETVWFDRKPEIVKIYAITPTYRRSNQIPELTRLCTVFTVAGNIRWIVVEDANRKSGNLSHFLHECGVPHVHLNATSAKSKRLIRGSNQRNEALRWLRGNIRPNQERGVVYFADDDNTYHPDLFAEIRTLRRGATWPVGLIASSQWEGCITGPGDRSKIKSFWTSVWYNRTFPIDMAGFAVSLDLVLQKPKALFDNHTVGKQEGLFLSALGFKNAFELEPKADGCTRVSSRKSLCTRFYRFCSLTRSRLGS